MIEKTFAHVLNENADGSLWKKRVLESKAQFLFVDRTGPEDAPERKFVEGDIARFLPLFQDEGAWIYRVNR